MSETLSEAGVNKVLMASLSNTGCLFLSLAFWRSNFYTVFAYSWWTFILKLQMCWSLIPIRAARS